MSECVDNQARGQAGAALIRIDGHEGHCGERYAQINATLTRLHERIDKLMYWTVSGFAVLIGSLWAGLIAYFS